MQGGREMETKKKIVDELDYGFYLGCAMSSWVFVVLIILSGLLIVIFGSIDWEKSLPLFTFLFTFLITVALSLAVYYTYKCHKYLKERKQK